MTDVSAMSLKRIVRAARHSLDGLRGAWRTEPAFRQEVLLLIVAVPAALWLTRDNLERAILIASVALVLVVELLNTAVESVVDRIGRERHELSGRAKDAGSAAVLVSLLLAGAVWLVVLLG